MAKKQKLKSDSEMFVNLIITAVTFGIWQHNFVAGVFIAVLLNFLWVLTTYLTTKNED